MTPRLVPPVAERRIAAIACPAMRLPVQMTLAAGGRIG